MKKIILYLFLTIVTVYSCEIERFPYGQLEQSQAFKTMNDAKALNNGLYILLRNRIYGQYMFATDIQADLYNASLDYGNRFGFNHRWDGFLSDDYSIRDIWQGYYAALANINSFINNHSLVDTPTDTDKSLMNQYVGEAYLMRAFYYHQLILRFAKSYDAATASTDLGVPLVLDFDVTLRPPRATVAQVYAQILSDIQQAKTKLPAVTGSPVKTRINKDAVLALESRVYLHMKNYNEVITAAQNLISTNRYPLISSTAAFETMWKNDSGTEIITQLQASTPSELPTSSNSQNFLNYQSGTQRYWPDWIPQQWVVDIYSNDDIRKNVYLKNLPIKIQGTDYTVYLLNKYPGNPALFTGAISNYQHKPIMFRIAETYLNMIEAQYHTNPSAALTSLNSFRLVRGLGPVSLSGTALYEEIKNERTRELLAEGMRLNDLKRWNDPVVRRTPQNMGPIIVSPANQYHLLNKPANDPKFVWAIPARDMTANPNMVQNEGW